jgi:hypothetical protein
MANNSSAHSSRGGYNQSGGAYFIVIASLDNALGVAPSYINTLATGSSNSGGGWTAPTFVATSMSSVLGLTATTAHYQFGSTIVGPGALLKDMGRTAISSGRTFRKFEPVVASAATVSSMGVVGGPAVVPNAGYGSFYLEVGREGNSGAAGPAPIARYF